MFIGWIFTGIALLARWIVLCWLILLQLTSLDFSEMRQDVTGFNFSLYPVAISEQREHKGTEIFVMGASVHIPIYLLKLLTKIGCANL